MLHCINYLTVITIPEPTKDDGGLPSDSPVSQDSDSLVLWDKKDRSEFDSNIDIGNKSTTDYWVDYMSRSELGKFRAQAYANDSGISIRTNPVTGYNELFIAGTRTGRDWAQNFAEGLGTAWNGLSKDMPNSIAKELIDDGLEVSEMHKAQFAQHLDELIEENNVKVVYGHSRGAAHLSLLKSDVTRIGVDGATSIGDRSDFLNLRSSSLFDKGLGMAHENNLEIPNTLFHDVTTQKGTDAYTAVADEEDNARYAKYLEKKKAKVSTKGILKKYNPVALRAERKRHYDKPRTKRSRGGSNTYAQTVKSTKRAKTFSEQNKAWGEKYGSAPQEGVVIKHSPTVKNLREYRYSGEKKNKLQKVHHTYDLDFPNKPMKKMKKQKKIRGWKAPEEDEDFMDFDF